MPSELNVVGWRVWCADRNVYCSAQHGNWSGLPKDGALIVMIYFANGSKRIMHGADYYWRWDDGGEVAYARSDFEKPDPARYPGVELIRGKWTTDARYAAAEAEAMQSTWP